MSTVAVSFTKDILLDQDQFQSAANRFEQLSEDMTSLRQDIDKLLEELEKGFDTPAGRKFISSCKTSLLQPMDDMTAVIQHVSDNLSQARLKYESVFTEFQFVNNAINSI